MVLPINNDYRKLDSGHGEHDVADLIENNLKLFLRLLRQVLKEYNELTLKDFDKLRYFAISARNNSDEDIYLEAQDYIASLSIERGEELVRALTCYFHLANLAEEFYRVSQIKRKEANDFDISEGNVLGEAFLKLSAEVGEESAFKRIKSLKFYPVLTAHPTEARRKAINGKITRIGKLLGQHQFLGGISLIENERLMLNEIDMMFRTYPIAFKKPTPIEESDTVIDAVDQTMFVGFVDVIRRFDNFLQRKITNTDAGYQKPFVAPFVKLGSWVGSDRDGNPNVTANITRKIAAKYHRFIIDKYCKTLFEVGKNMTLESVTTPPSKDLLLLLTKLKNSLNVDESDVYQNMFYDKEPHRAVLLLIHKKLELTKKEKYGLSYQSSDNLLSDLRVVQNSLLEAKANRSAYGFLQALIWQIETFGMHLSSMEVRQHSQVHREALEEINNLNSSDNSDHNFTIKTKEVLDTFASISTIQNMYGNDALSRYIISFTQSAQDIQNVIQLIEYTENKFENKLDLSIIPLFETMQDLDNSISILDQMIKFDRIKAYLDSHNRELEVMLGYSDSSKDVGPVAATFALHKAQSNIAKWALDNNIKLVLFHGRGGALGRGGGPAHRAIIAQPKDSVNHIFKLTEQGEVIFSRYSNHDLAIRHIESIAAATLLNSAPSVEEKNEQMTKKYSNLVDDLSDYSKESFRNLVNIDDFASWFAKVTPLEEIGMLPIGSRPAKRGLSTKSLEDLRAIPWVFSWSQARINLAAWYGFGSACQKVYEKYGDARLLKSAYRDWNLFSTLVDNIEMSIAKTDLRIAKSYLDLGARDELSKLVLDEMVLTQKWVLKLTNSSFPLENRRVMGQAVQIRSPYVDALSYLQISALRKLRESTDNEIDEDYKCRLQQLILSTVAGISAGLQNTG